MQKRNKKLSEGFTLMELVVVMVILAILVVVVLPSIGTFVPGQRVRGEAGQIRSLLQKARLRAMTAKKPVRLDLDCRAREINAEEPCSTGMALGSYENNVFKEWEVLGSRHILDSDVEIKPGFLNSEFDGPRRIPGVSWIIFMPTSQTFSDPSPFEVIFCSKSCKPGNKIYSVSAGTDSGRIISKPVN